VCAKIARGARSRGLVAFQAAREKPSGDDDDGDDDGVGTGGERRTGRERSREENTEIEKRRADVRERGRRARGGAERRGRPRKQVPGQTGRPTADRPTGRRTQVTHPDSTNNQTPRALSPAVSPVRGASRCWVARCSSSSRLPSPRRWLSLLRTSAAVRRILTGQEAEEQRGSSARTAPKTRDRRGGEGRRDGRIDVL